VSARQRLPQDPALTSQIERLLAEGDLEIQGRIMPASNATFFGEVTLGGVVERCVYKPVAGERPLWDFPDGTLAAREVAAYAVSEAIGWDIVPATILRDGPAGPGMVQLWRDPDESLAAVDVVPAGRVPTDFLHVLDAYDGRDRRVALVHEDSAPLRRMAVFDVLVNNADRKGGHVLAMTDGRRYGVDHGVCFNLDDKLRTVLWGWAGESLLPEHRAAVEKVLLDDALRTRLCELLDRDEVGAFRKRCKRFLSTGRMPVPTGDWPSVPWPAF
jgi:uncharacterized repeat protein (TIGR03843 family)